MATRGAQPGNQNQSKGRPWREALDKALKRYESKELQIERGQALYQIALRCVADALQGDKDARAEIANRLDGKPAQSVDVTSGGKELGVAVIGAPPKEPQ